MAGRHCARGANPGLRNALGHFSLARSPLPRHSPHPRLDADAGATLDGLAGCSSPPCSVFSVGIPADAEHIGSLRGRSTLLCAASSMEELQYARPQGQAALHASCFPLAATPIAAQSSRTIPPTEPSPSVALCSSPPGTYRRNWTITATRAPWSPLGGVCAGHCASKNAQCRSKVIFQVSSLTHFVMPPRSGITHSMGFLGSASELVNRPPQEPSSSILSRCNTSDPANQSHPQRAVGVPSHASASASALSRAPATAQAHQHFLHANAALSPEPSSGSAPGAPGEVQRLQRLRAQQQQQQQRKQQEAARSQLLYLSALVAAMVGASYAAVPLYRMFCQATGFGGTTQRKETVEQKLGVQRKDGAGGGAHPQTEEDKELTRAKEVAEVAARRQLVVHFNADVADGLPWKFTPCQKELRLRPGQSTLAFYTAHNRSKEPITGVSTYNVSPMKAGVYFNKIQCFCFEEQRLQPGEKIDMPVFFYIDPEFAVDPNMDDISNLTLSYTFFKAS